MRNLWLTFTLAITTHGFYALATPIHIPPCQTLLVGQREHLAWIEMDKFKTLRVRDSEVLRQTLGLLLAVHESRLDGEPIGVEEARSFIPANARLAQTWMNQAVDLGLLTMGRSTTNRKFRVVAAGPALFDLVTDRINAHLAHVFEDARALLPARRSKIGYPPAIRSEKLDRLLISQMWADYARAWGLNGNKDSAFVRTGYGLLVHLYHLALHGRHPSAAEVLPRVPGGTVSARRQFVRGLIDQGLIDESATPLSQPRLSLSTEAISLIERRMNANIDRTNGILREALVREPTPATLPSDFGFHQSN